MGLLLLLELGQFFSVSLTKGTGETVQVGLVRNGMTLIRRIGPTLSMLVFHLQRALVVSDRVAHSPEQVTLMGSQTSIQNGVIQVVRRDILAVCVVNVRCTALFLPFRSLDLSQFTNSFLLFFRRGI